MKYVCIMGFAIAVIVYGIIVANCLLRKMDLIIPMWIALAFIWIFNIGIKVYQ